MPIDPQAQIIVTYLIQAQAQIGSGIFGSSQRPWMNFSGVLGADGPQNIPSAQGQTGLSGVGKFDFAGVHALFDRSASNDAYVNGRSNTDTTVVDLQTTKISADLLAGLERDYRMRTRSRVRTMIHAGNRSAGNGLDVGALNKNTIGWLTRIAGASNVETSSAAPSGD